MLKFGNKKNGSEPKNNVPLSQILYDVNSVPIGSSGNYGEMKEEDLDNITGGNLLSDEQEEKQRETIDAYRGELSEGDLENYYGGVPNYSDEEKGMSR